MTLLSADAEAEYIQAQIRATLHQSSTELWQQRERVLRLWHSKYAKRQHVGCERQVFVESAFVDGEFMR